MIAVFKVRKDTEIIIQRDLGKSACYPEGTIHVSIGELQKGGDVYVDQYVLTVFPTGGMVAPGCQDQDITFTEGQVL